MSEKYARQIRKEIRALKNKAYDEAFSNAFLDIYNAVHERVEKLSLWKRIKIAIKFIIKKDIKDFF